MVSAKNMEKARSIKRLCTTYLDLHGSHIHRRNTIVPVELIISRKKVVSAMNQCGPEDDLSRTGGLLRHNSPMVWGLVAIAMNTTSGGAPAESPVGETSPGMQVQPKKMIVWRLGVNIT
jgi:hypothetical protein